MNTYISDREESSNIKGWCVNQLDTSEKNERNEKKREVEEKEIDLRNWGSRCKRGSRRNFSRSVHKGGSGSKDGDGNGPSSQQ